MITIPWEHLKSDNDRLMPVILGKTAAGKPRVRTITAPEYRAAKIACAQHCTDQWREPKLSGVLALRGLLFFPDRRQRDTGNYRKLITDALTGVAYTDDSQLHREIWDFGGLDRAHPRVEIQIVPFRLIHQLAEVEILSLAL